MTQPTAPDQLPGQLPLGSLGRALVRHWLLIGLAIVLGAGAGWGVTLLIQPRYQATATQLIIGIPGEEATANYQAAQFAVSRAKSYPSFIHSVEVLDGVVEDLDGAIDAATLRDDLSAANPIDTPLVRVTAEANSAELAQRIANSAASHLSAFITTIESVDGSAPVRVRSAVEAALPKEATSPRRSLLMALGASIGLVLGVAGAVVLQYLPRRRSQRGPDVSPAQEPPTEAISALPASAVVGDPTPEAEPAAETAPVSEEVPTQPTPEEPSLDAGDEAPSPPEDTPVEPPSSEDEAGVTEDFDLDEWLAQEDTEEPATLSSDEEIPVDPELEELDPSEADQGQATDTDDEDDRVAEAAGHRQG